MKFAQIAAFCTLAASLPAQQPTATGETPVKEKVKASIEGQVFNLNTGAPVRKVTVRLTGRQTTPSSRPTNLTVQTGDDGHFAFADLDAGKYQLSAQKPGFVGNTYGARRPMTGGTPLTVGEGQRVKDIVFKLMPGAVIAGKVLDEEGEPMANVSVMALQPRIVGGKKRMISEGTGANTTDLGEFRISGLPPGQYVVQASMHNFNFGETTKADGPLPDKPELGYVTTFYPNVTDQSAAASVTVGAGAELRGIDVKVVKTKVFRIRGKVVAPELPKGRSVMVMLLANNSLGFSMFGQAQAQPPDLRFEFKNIVPGSYAINALVSQEGRPQVAVMPVEVGDAHVDGVVIAASAPHDVHGTVKIAEREAQVDASTIDINLMPAGMMLFGAPQATVESDLKFTVKNVSPGKYRVNALALPDNCYVQSIAYGGQDIPEDGVDMSGGGAIEVVISTTGAQLDVTTADRDGRPIAGAALALIPKDRPRTEMKAGTSDQNGQASFKSLRPGDYKIFAFEDVEGGAVQDTEFMKDFESRATEQKLAPGAHQSIQIKVIPAEDTAGKSIRVN